LIFRRHCFRAMYIIIMDINADNAPAPAADRSAPRPVLYARFPRSFGFEFALQIFFCPPLVVLWSFVAYYYYLNGAVSFPILKVAVYYTAAFVLVTLLYGNDRAARRGKGIILDGEHIVEKNSGGVNMLDYAEMRGVRCTKNPLFNKKMVIAHTAGKTLLPLNLSGSYKMVETVIETLRSGGRLNEAEKTTASENRRLYVTAVQYNALYKIREKHIQTFLAVSIASAVFNGMVAALYWKRGLGPALAWGFCGMLFQTLGYLAAERFWAWKRFNRVEAYHPNSTNDEEDYALFKTVHAVSALTALFAGMVAGIAVTLPAM